MEETKMYCDICRERIIGCDYSSSCLIKPYIHRNIVKDLQIDICPLCREKIKNNDTRNNYLEILGYFIFDILKKLI